MEKPDDPKDLPSDFYFQMGGLVMSMLIPSRYAKFVAELRSSAELRKSVRTMQRALTFALGEAGGAEETDVLTLEDIRREARGLPLK